VEHVWILASVWVLPALVATLFAIWFKTSTALTEIVVGVLGQLLALRYWGHAAGWRRARDGPHFLAGAGAIILTFLAGAELDPTCLATRKGEHAAVRIVIISDVHGNYDALSALPERYDELWVLGDLVNYGPEPQEVVDFVKRNAAAVVRGNHDHSIGYGEDPRCTPRYRDMADATRRYSDSVLTPDQKQLLRNLPVNLRLRRANKTFYLVHARPSDPLYGYCPADSEEWVREVESVVADVVLVGHTHTPFIRQIGNSTLVNPGSVGQPKTGKADACYAVWEDGDVELKTYPYPLEKTISKIRTMPIPPAIQRDLSTVLRTGSV